MIIATVIIVTIAAFAVTRSMATNRIKDTLGFIGYANIWLAVFADTGVAMLCILNSLRLLGYRID